MARHLQLLTVLTMSNELSDTEFETDEQVVARALSIYRSAKAAGSAALMQEHVQSWAELWRGGEHHRWTALFLFSLGWVAHTDWLFQAASSWRRTICSCNRRPIRAGTTCS